MNLSRETIAAVFGIMHIDHNAWLPNEREIVARALPALLDAAEEAERLRDALADEKAAHTGHRGTEWYYEQATAERDKLRAAVAAVRELCDEEELDFQSGGYPEGRNEPEVTVAQLRAALDAHLGDGRVR